MFLKNIDMMCFDWTIFGGQVGSLKVTKVPGGHSGTEGGRTLVTYFAEEGDFF